MSINLASLNTVMLTNLNSQVHILANYNKAFLYLTSGLNITNITKVVIYNYSQLISYKYTS